MWVFGYGSLIWKTDFPYETKIVGHIDGYDRRFYQHSTDHRGTPEKPGRVVTLIPSPNGRVYGIAYKIRADDEISVLNYLDHREKGGYERMKVLFHPKDSKIKSFDILIYVASTDNNNYAGPADDDAIARQIVDCVGPSGPNVEYVFKLANAMREVMPDVEDDHLFSIEQKVMNLYKNQKNVV